MNEGWRRFLALLVFLAVLLIGWSIEHAGTFAKCSTAPSDSPTRAAEVCTQ